MIALHDPDLPFLPILRFAVCSDIHMQTIGDERAGRLRHWIQSAYSIAQHDALYPALDALLFAGDLTDHGTRDEVAAFWRVVSEEKRDGTQILSVLAKCHDNWSEGRNSPKDGMRFYREITGLPTSYRFVIGGCSFIGISTSEQTGVYYDESQRQWLSDALADAARETSGKPIFVMHHEHAMGTVFGSLPQDGWGNDYFCDLFKLYPQIVHLSGHSHYPLNDPRSVWQGEYTAVGTGALSYAELTVDGQNKLHPPGHEKIAQGWIVELDAHNRLRLRGIDALSDTLLCEIILDLSDPPQTFSQTPQQQYARAAAPVFDNDARMQSMQTEDGIKLTIPPAHCPDGAPVFLYRVCATDPAGSVLHSAVVIPEYWRADPAPLCVMLPKSRSDSIIQVHAENAFGMRSPTIRKEMHSEQ